MNEDNREYRRSIHTVKLEMLEYLGQWRARLVVTEQFDDGEYAEPYVLTAEMRPLLMVGPGWTALAALQEFMRHLDAALRDGYE